MVAGTNTAVGGAPGDGVGVEQEVFLALDEIFAVLAGHLTDIEDGIREVGKDFNALISAGTFLVCFGGKKPVLHQGERGHGNLGGVEVCREERGVGEHSEKTRLGLNAGVACFGGDFGEVNEPRAGDLGVEKFGAGEWGEDIQCADRDESRNGDVAETFNRIVGDAGIALALETLAGLRVLVGAGVATGLIHVVGVRGHPGRRPNPEEQELHELAERGDGAHVFEMGENALHVVVAFGPCADQHELGDSGGVAKREFLRDGTAHGESGHVRGGNALGIHEGGDVVGHDGSGVGTGRCRGEADATVVDEVALKVLFVGFDVLFPDGAVGTEPHDEHQGRAFAAGDKVKFGGGRFGGHGRREFSIYELRVSKLGSRFF